MNLNVFIAKSGVCSRRDASALVKDGKVTVNGKVVLEPWSGIGAKDSVKVRGKLLRQEGNVYILFNKPRGVTVTLEDKFAETTIAELVPKKFGRVYPVGRLDKPSRGLIILTNDGDLCYRLTHPKFAVEKEYLVTIKGRADESILKKLKKGVVEGGELLKVREAYIEHADSARSRLKIVVCEGKKRHLRRLLEELGFEVLDLMRVRIAGLRLGGIKEGKFSLIDRDSIYGAVEKDS
jgi:23S rRNA pseudouridine2605 synthase